MPTSGLSADEVAGMTVKLLKQELASRGLDTAGKKADLADRLADAVLRAPDAQEGQAEPSGSEAAGSEAPTPAATDSAAAVAPEQPQVATAGALKEQNSAKQAIKRERSPEPVVAESSSKRAAGEGAAMGAFATDGKQAAKRGRSPEPVTTSSASRKRAAARPTASAASTVAVKPDPNPPAGANGPTPDDGVAVVKVKAEVKTEPGVSLQRDAEDDVYEEVAEDRTHSCPYLDTINRWVWEPCCM